MTPLCFLHETAKVLHAAEFRIDPAIVGNIVAVIAPRGRIERQQPQRRNPEVPEIIELLGQPGEVADPVIIAVEKRLDVELVNDRVLEP